MWFNSNLCLVKTARRWLCKRQFIKRKIWLSQIFFKTLYAVIIWIEQRENIHETGRLDICWNCPTIYSKMDEMEFEWNSFFSRGYFRTFLESLSWQKFKLKSQKDPRKDKLRHLFNLENTSVNSINILYPATYFLMNASQITIIAYVINWILSLALVFLTCNFMNLLTVYILSK